MARLRRSLLRLAAVACVVASGAACTSVHAAPLGAPARPATRIVSLGPTFTEDLFAIGAGTQVVGTDGYSNRPAAARALPKVGRYQSINTELILTLHPDLIVDTPSQTPSLRVLARAGIPLEQLPIDSVADEKHAIERLGVLTGHVRESTALVAHLDAHFAAVTRATSRERTLSGFVVLDVGPIYTAGGTSYIDALMRFANVRNIAHPLRLAWPVYAAESLETEQPDVLIVPSTVTLPAIPPWTRLNAVRHGHIVRLADDDISRPGPHVVDVLDALVAQLQKFR